MLNYIKCLFRTYNESKKIKDRVLYAHSFYHKIENDLMAEQHAYAINVCIEADLHGLFEFRALFSAIAESAESNEPLNSFISVKLIDVSNNVIGYTCFNSDRHINNTI